MSRAILWPAAPAADMPATLADQPAIRDEAAFAASFGPELTRLLGARATAHPLADHGRKAAALSHSVARLRLPSAQPAAPATLVTLLLAPADIARLLDILFGAAPATAGGVLPALPPGSASWTTLARFLASAATRALAAAGQPCVGAAEILPRATPRTDGGEPQLLLRLDIDGADIVIGFRLDGQAKPAPPEPKPDPELWRQRARNRAFDLALPVALRLAEKRLPVREVAALKPGDILPLDRPAHVELLAGGRRFAMLPASQFAPRQGVQPEENAAAQANWQTQEKAP